MKTAEDYLIDAIKEHTNLKEEDDFKTAFRQFWFLYDPSPASHIILKAMEAYAGQKKEWISVESGFPPIGTWVTGAKKAGVMLNPYQIEKLRGQLEMVNYDFPFGDKNITHYKIFDLTPPTP